MRKKALFCCSTVALVFGAVYGCASGGADSLDGDLSSVSFAQIANFTGNSVMICGTRDPAADNKYPCLSELPCTCFEFAADGTLVDGTVTGLCPSVNVPAGDWTFTYEIWSGAGCTGEVLNAAGNPNNFVCYDVADLVTQVNPNESVEELEIGENVNHIICTSEGAEKEWNFYSCLVVAPSVYECGCTVVGAGCDCGALTAADLPAGCAFDAACNIDCAP